MLICHLVQRGKSIKCVKYDKIKTFVRSSLMYRSETNVVLEKDMNTFHVAEMKTLNWMCSVTRFKRGNLSVRAIARQERRECELKNTKLL